MNDFYVYVYLDQRFKGNYVYKDIVFPFKPFYVGKGTRRRSKVHTCPSLLKSKTLKSSIIKAIKREIGELPINLIAFDNLTEKKALQIEKKLIKHFGRADMKTGILANHTDGGEGVSGYKFEKPPKAPKPVYQYSMTGAFIKKWESIISTQSLGITSANICTSIKRNGTCAGYIWSYRYMGRKINPKIKYQMPIKYVNIKQIDLETKEVIRVFKTVRDAQEQLGLNIAALGKIPECIRGVGGMKSMYGYGWSL